MQCRLAASMILIAGCAAVNGFSQGCPGCYHNFTPLAGHGPAPDGSGRRVINIYLDSSLNSAPNTTNPKVWNAFVGVQNGSQTTVGAVNKWNNATDQYGNKTGYYFQVNQSAGPSGADIVVSLSPQLSNSNVGAGYQPGKILVNPDTINATTNTLDDMAGMFAHELGHALGEDEGYGNATCSPDAPTIMNGLYTGWIPISSNVQQYDVTLANMALNSPGSCTRTPGDAGNPGGDSSGGSGGSGGPGPGCSQQCGSSCMDNLNCGPDATPVCVDSAPYCQTNETPTCDTGEAGNCSDCQPPPCDYPYSWDEELCSCYLDGSPIIIDTDGSGFHLTSAKNGVLFDFLGNGTPIQLAWTAKGSTNGWLALDRNDNGTIDSAKELFGNITEQPKSADPNGFLALAVFDEPENGGNGDGIIDRHDAVWSKLLVWIDSNHDGISQPNELHHLEEIGIHSIGLMYTESRREDAYGNEFRYKGSLNPDRRDDVNRVIYDVFLTSLTR